MIGDIDRELWARGRIVVGVDEVGKGPLAGPVTTGAVLLRSDPGIPGINDSKKLSPEKREFLSEKLWTSVRCAVVSISQNEINASGIEGCTKKAMLEAVYKLFDSEDGPPSNVIVLVDGPKPIPNLNLPHREIIKGDSLSLAIAAASIVAKVERDSFMIEMDKKFPVYGFAQHKGYGTPQHIEAIRQHGPCELHRTRFVRSALKTHAQNTSFETDKSRQVLQLWKDSLEKP